MPPETYPVIERIDEMSENKEYPKYVALQSDAYRRIYVYSEDKNKYDITMEHALLFGSSMQFDIATLEQALEQMEDLKKKGFLMFRKPSEVSWYATRENNTPYEEQWEVKDGYYVPVNSHSADVYTFDGVICSFVDQWLDISTDTKYVLGQCKEDKDFYYARVIEEYKKYEYEFDHKPERKEVEDRHIDNIAAIAINRHEEEVYEQIYGNADRLAIEKEVTAEMKAEALFKGDAVEQIMHPERIPGCHRKGR